MVNTRRLVAVAALCVFLVLAAGRQEAAGEETKYMTYPSKMIKCEALGNCEKNTGPDATRPGKPANPYTRGCNKIERCRG